MRPHDKCYSSVVARARRELYDERYAIKYSTSISRGQRLEGQCGLSQNRVPRAVIH